MRFGAATLATVPSVLASAGASGGNGRHLRIGILADVHLKDPVAAQKLERALTAFRDGCVDGVLICGDLADNGVVPQLEELAKVWESVFPESKGLDGAPVERLFHYGDHDNRGHWMAGESESVRQRYGWTDEELAEKACFLHSKEHWERIFGEPWSPIVHKRVKGYDFVLSHYTAKGGNSPFGLANFLKGFKPDPTRPFFYSQHRVLRNTVCGPGVWGQDNGTAGRLLAAYPNCCAFCGHSHQTAVREDSIWQGAFTAVQVPSLKYVTFESGHANHPNGSAAEQGMLLDVYDERMVIQRIDFANRKELAPAWTIPLVEGARPFAHEARRRAAPVPEFAAGARLATKILSEKGGKTLTLEFPVVSGRDGGVRAYDYMVTVDAICFGGDAQRVVRRFFSPQCHFAREAEPETMKVRIALGGFAKWNSLKSKNWGALHVSVRPREVFGGLGRPLEVDV